MLDGRPVQVTDASLNTFPGKHVIILEKPGFQRATREIIVSRGKTAELVVDPRESRNLSNAAERLGIAPVSLSRWIGRRKLPMYVEP